MSKTESNIVKGIAIFMMLCHHLWGFPERFPGYEIPHFLHVFGLSFCRLCVSLFLFVSGYGFAKSFEKKGFSYLDSKNRILKTYSSYWKIFLIFIPIGFLGGWLSFDWKEMLLNIFCIDRSYNGEWWFLSMYIEMLLVYPILCMAKNKKKIVVLAFISIIISRIFLDLCFDGVFPKKLGLKHLYYILYYWGILMVGSLCAYGNVFETVRKKFSGKYFFLLWGFGTVVLMAIRKSLDVPEITLLCVPMLILTVLSLPFRKRWERIVAFMGEKSMNVWLIHSFICYYYWQNLLLALKNPFLILLALTLSSFCLAVIVDKIWMSVLLKGRREK